jgi:glycosyltransferase involved in cell wall biosynthesis
LRKIAYLIPEFPGQTHTWIWRELHWMRRWGVPIRIVSTRPPPDRDRARHAFSSAASETFYLHDRMAPSIVRTSGATMRAFAHGPAPFLATSRLAYGLPLDPGLAGWRSVSLVPAAARLISLCRAESITHVHCHTSANGAVIAMLAHAMGGPPYSMCINANLGWWGGAMTEKIAASAFCTSTMRWVKDEIDRDYPADVARKTHYAPVGVDTDVWRPPANRRKLTDHAIDLLVVGRLHPSKGFDVALHALAQCRSAGVDAFLTVLGDGPERGALEAVAASLHLAGHVSFRGSVPEQDVRATMGSADIFLLPSHAEPLGVVVMEAMALGTPVIVTGSGGVGEIVTPGVDAVTVPPGDAAALAQAIISLQGDPQRRQALARTGREAIVRKFDSRVGAARLYGLLFGTEPPSDPQGQDVSLEPA